MPEVAGQGALLVDPFSVEQIAAAMARVYHHLEVRAQLVAQGKVNATRFSWEQSSARVMQVLEEVVYGNQEARAIL
jgi:glycosyltransferase involved in cell wall biosynthesis